MNDSPTYAVIFDTYRIENFGSMKNPLWKFQNGCNYVYRAGLASLQEAYNEHGNFIELAEQKKLGLTHTGMAREYVVASKIVPENELVEYEQLVEFVVPAEMQAKGKEPFIPGHMGQDFSNELGEPSGGEEREHWQADFDKALDNMEGEPVGNIWNYLMSNSDIWNRMFWRSPKQTYADFLSKIKKQRTLH